VSSPVDIARLTDLAATGEPFDPAEVREIYLPLLAFLRRDMAAVRSRRSDLARLLGLEAPSPTYVLAIAGSVAAGKSTTARVLQALLGSRVRTALVTTDGFLRPNAWLQSHGLMDRKGWPESYDVAALLRFLADLRAGRGPLEVPRYSHVVYDVIDGDPMVIDRPDVLILEGLNVLQVGPASSVYVTDFVDRSLFVDADVDHLEAWYVERFMTLRRTVFTDPRSHFRRYAELDDTEAEATARRIWRDINLPNLMQNILPTRERADIVLEKRRDHRIQRVRLRGV
jgi:type I pantothenate kinase